VQAQAAVLDGHGRAAIFQQSDPLGRHDIGCQHDLDLAARVMRLVEPDDRAAPVLGGFHRLDHRALAHAMGDGTQPRRLPRRATRDQAGRKFSDAASARTITRVSPGCGKSA
jgi:hypothetical protein